MDGATGEQRPPMEESCGVSVFPTGRNRASGKHPGPTETVSTASLFPTAADDKLFGITRGARTYLRPWRPDFLSARGKNWPLCPWQAVFHVARGCGALICPWQAVFHVARGCGALICPWQASPHNSGAVEPVFVSAAVRGGAGEGSAVAGAVGTAPVPAPAGSEDGSRARSSPGGKRAKRDKRAKQAKQGKRGKRSGQAGPHFTFVPFVFGIMLSGHSDPEIFAKIPDCA